MKKTALLFCLLSVALVRLALSQTVTVTPQTLAAWTVSGTDRATLSQSEVLTLPAGAQLSRSFDSSFVNVKFKGQPVFAPTSDDFITVEAGPAALAFVSDGNNGRVVLVIGENQVITLPYAIKVNAEGASSDPVDLQLAYERTSGLVVVTGFGQSLEYAANPSAAPADVVVTTGAHSALTLTSLAVQVDSQAAIDGAGNNANTPPATSTGSSDGLAKIRKSAGGGLDSSSSGSKGPASGTDTSATPKPAETRLEVYTPAAVHYGRVDLVRAAAMKSLTPGGHQ